MLILSGSYLACALQLTAILQWPEHNLLFILVISGFIFY